jgi:hypothetical protein
VGDELTMQRVRGRCNVTPFDGRMDGWTDGQTGRRLLTPGYARRLSARQSGLQRDNFSGARAAAGGAAAAAAGQGAAAAAG